MRWIALVPTLLTGCSLALVSGPPRNHQQLPAFQCTTSRIVPALDTAWTILQTANFALAASKNEQEWDATFDGDPPISHSVAIPMYAGLAVLGAAGMYFGFSRTAECRRARTELMFRAADGQQPGTWPPPAPAPYPQPQPPPPPPPAPAPPPPPPPAPDPY